MCFTPPNVWSSVTEREFSLPPVAIQRDKWILFDSNVNVVESRIQQSAPCLQLGVLSLQDLKDERSTVLAWPSTDFEHNRLRLWPQNQSVWQNAWWSDPEVLSRLEKGEKYRVVEIKYCIVTPAEAPGRSERWIWVVSRAKDELSGYWGLVAFVLVCVCFCHLWVTAQRKVELPLIVGMLAVLYTSSKEIIHYILIEYPGIFYWIKLICCNVLAWIDSFLFDGPN